MGAREHSTTSGQPICRGSCQHLLPAGSSSWALQGAALRLHPASLKLCPGVQRSLYPVCVCDPALPGWVTPVPREEREAESAGLLPK